MASTFIQKDFSSAGNRKIFTFSTWYKFTTGDPAGSHVLFSAGSASNNYCQLRIRAQDYIQLEDETASGVNSSIYTSAFFRDPTAWSHFVLRVDTTQGTAGRISFYVDFHSEDELVSLRTDNNIQVKAVSESNFVAANIDLNTEFFLTLNP